METKQFQLVSRFKPTGDQPYAIENIVSGIKSNKKVQVLLGATGTGKTFTMANIIEKVQRPVLVLVHNKTLAGQLYDEFKELFPNNRVEYFVSNFDFYQPEAYIPSTDTYIDKNAVMNEEIEMMRTAAIQSVLERRDTIVVASVASIYGLTDPQEYRSLIFDLRVGESLDRDTFFEKLVTSQYVRNDLDLKPGTFRVRGDIIEFIPASLSKNEAIRIDTFGDEIESISLVDLLNGKVKHTFSTFPVFPSYDHVATKKRILEACKLIRIELQERLAYFKNNDKFLEAERLDFRTRQDLESLEEFGTCPGIENYSRFIDKREKGSKPFCLLDYFPKDFLLFIDESHATIPQIRGMFNGDQARKKSLVDFGFRLPSALDNRPLSFLEFEAMMPQTICTSATPGDYELSRSGGISAEQIIRPTGLLDPSIFVRPSFGQIDDLCNEIDKRIPLNEKIMIITLTVKMAEDLTSYLKDRNYKVVYLHHETKTLERSEVIYQLRKGKYDVLVGINLLREGLDIPEVSLVAILDADKEGFLRSERSLIQISGRTARNANGVVIMYADHISEAMQRCIDETSRRRDIQQSYNKENGIVPRTIQKPIRPPIKTVDNISSESLMNRHLSRKQLEQTIKNLSKEMRSAAKEYDFERAAELRDIIFDIKSKINI